MADKTKIEWTDATWNPLRGCTRVSEGCRHCYAEQVAARFCGPGQPYDGLARRVGGEARWTGRVSLVERALRQPLRWRRPRKIFVNSTSDLFHESVPDEWIDRIFAVMALCPQHTFQVLTKRGERMRAYIAKRSLDWQAVLANANPPGTLQVTKNDIYRTLGLAAKFPHDPPTTAWPLSNVWLGVSVEDQAAADERRGPLSAIAAQGWLTWVSYEPALGPVDWADWEFIKWLVSGGESGQNSRPSHPAWHRAARDFCAAYGIAYLFKQWGEWAPGEGWYEDHPVSLPLRMLGPGGWTDNLPGDDEYVVRIGKRGAGRLLDGVLHDAYPEVRS
jgi:protein gp37